MKKSAFVEALKVKSMEKRIENVITPAVIHSQKFQKTNDPT